MQCFKVKRIKVTKEGKMNYRDEKNTLKGGGDVGTKGMEIEHTK